MPQFDERKLIIEGRKVMARALTLKAITSSRFATRTVTPSEHSNTRRNKTMTRPQELFTMFAVAVAFWFVVAVLFIL